MKIEKLHRNTWNKSGTKYREENKCEKCGKDLVPEMVEGTGEDGSLVYGTDWVCPDFDCRFKPDKLQRLLEWVERYSVYKNKRWLCPDNIMIKDLTAKIKELMDEE